MPTQRAEEPMHEDGRSSEDSAFVTEKPAIPSDTTVKEVIDLPPWPGEIREVHEQESPGK